MARRQANTPPIDVVVSPTGSDANPGTYASPVATLAAAQSIARQKIAKGLTRNCNIFLRAGTYALASMLALTAADSGNNGFNVGWLAWPGESVTVGGHVTVTGWSLYSTVNGNAVYSASVNSTITNAKPRQIWVNGTRCTRARNGNGGSGFTISGNTVSGTGGYLFPSSAQTRNITDVEAVMASRWTESRCPVVSANAATITLLNSCVSLIASKPGVTTTTPTDWENVWEDFIGNATPGTFYLDRAAGKLYYVPRTGESMATATVAVPVLTQLITGSNVSRLWLGGIQFSYTTWDLTTTGFPEVQANTRFLYNPTTSDAFDIPPAAVGFDYSDHLTVHRCKFIGLGAAGLGLTRSTDCNVIGNLIKDISSNGYQGSHDNGWIGGRSARNVVANNVFRSCGAEFTRAVALIDWYSDSAIIRNNDIKSMPYSGISVGWGWGREYPNTNRGRLIYANRIDSVMQARANDGGAIYTNNAQNGEKIYANYTTNYGDKALYCDDGSRDVELYHNVIAGSGGNVFHNNNNMGQVNYHDNYATSTNGYGETGGPLYGTNGTGPNIYGTLNVSASPTNFDATAAAVVASAGVETMYADVLAGA